MSYENAKALDEAYIMHTFGRYPVEFVSGAGAVLLDENGKQYIDFLAGIGVVSLGHRHPAVQQALSRQLQRLWQSSNYFYDENRGELAKLLSELLSKKTDELGHINGSIGSVWKSFFSNSGAESNEGAFKVARRWGEKRLDGASGIITARTSFHGRTLATLAATGQDVFHKSFGPFPPGFASVPLNDIDAMVEAVEHPTEETGPVCGIMLECIQGEGGVWPADLDYVRDLRALCDEHGIAMMVDEVQTGFFRTGAPFSFQLAGIEPDIVSMAKGIADGFPMGAVAARGEFGDMLVPGDHGSTFGGNALASAAGRATVETLISEGIGSHVFAAGCHLARRLEALPHVTEVRGRGLLRGAQLDVPIANELVEQGLEAGLILNHIGDSILRFLPPLVISYEQIDAMAERLGALIEKLA